MSAVGTLIEVIGVVGSVITITDRLARWRQAEPNDSRRAKSAAWLDAWKLDEPKMIGVLVGIGVYVALSYAAARSAPTKIIGPVYLTSLAQSSAVFFGVLLGPSVGLSTGAVGYILTAAITTPHSSVAGLAYYPFPPAYSISDGLAGAAAGLASFALRSPRYPSGLRPVLVIAAVTAAAIAIGDIIAYNLLETQRIAPLPTVYHSGMRSDIVAGALVACVAVVAVRYRAGPDQARPAGR
jgi:hypothetical protein